MRYQWRLWGLLLAASPALWAAPMCTNTTLNTYTASGYTCQIGNAVFSNFSYNDDVGLGLTDDLDPVVAASDVTVNAGSSLFVPELMFSASTTGFPWQASGGFQNQITLAYTVTVPSTTPIEDSFVDLSGSVQNKGGLPSNITSTFNFSPSFNKLTPSLNPSNCGPAATTCMSTVSADLAIASLLQITVTDVITLDSGGFADSSPNVTTLTEFDQSFGEVPEPSAWLAVAFGLAACGWLGAGKTRATRSRQGN